MSEPFVFDADAHSNSSAHLPQPKNLSHHLSELARRREPSKIKSLYKYMQPGVLNLAGGMPHPTYFPFDTLEASIAAPDRFASEEPDVPNGLLASALSKLYFGGGGHGGPPLKSEHITVGKWEQPASGHAQDTINLASALQYSATVGYPALLKWVRDFTEALHGTIPYDHPEFCITDGSTDGISRTMATLLDKDEHLLVEEHAFGTALSTSSVWGVKAAPIPMDHYGLIPGKLVHILENWDVEKKGKRPHVLYTITIGQNPTGTRLPTKRRKEIYKIAQRYDIIIVEDDPYWFLQFKDQLPKKSNTKAKDPFFRSLAPSYLAYDTDGRVIRLDTFSKTICPGARCGWITAHPMLIDRLILHAENNASNASGFVQSMLASLLTRWDIKGWARWLEGLRDEYEKRRDVMIDNLHRGFTTQDDQVFVSERSPDYLHISTTSPLASFDTPAGGMFVWVTVRIEDHPLYKPEKKRELMDELWEHLAENKCLVAPGWVFATTEDIAQNRCEHLRLCFSAIETSQVKAASELFGRLTRQWFAEAHKKDKE